MDIERRAALAMLLGGPRRQRDLVDHGCSMVGEQQLRPIDAVEAEQALDEVGLPPEQQPGGDPSPAAVTAPGTKPIGLPASIAAINRGMAASPSPLITQSIAPAPCSMMALAVKEALCPPTQTKISGNRALVALARSTISGTFAR